LEPSIDSTGGQAVRIGLAAIRRIGEPLADRIVYERQQNGPFTGLTDLARRVRMTTQRWEALATAGAFGAFELERRAALWAAGAAAEDSPERLPGTEIGVAAPMLPGMDDVDTAVADVWAIGLSPTHFPTEFVRERLTRLGARTAAELLKVPSGTRVLAGGAVTHRQRPATAGGVTFLNLEDETGMVNVVCSPGLWARYRRVARISQALVVRGVLQNVEGALSLVADRLEPLDLRTTVPKSRDFR
ncbi:MAG TPA: OB-fold nucleic acid binding domain-containing protein, partial [Nakamurella sp.]